MNDVFLAPSIYRAVNPRTHSAIMAAVFSNPTDGRVIDETLWNDALIARSRSLLASRFIEADYLKNCDVMVTIDDDIVFEPQDFWKMVEGCRETRGIYGGAYVTRAEQPHLSSRVLPNQGSIQFLSTPQRRPFAVQYLATGFMAIHRDVVEAMVEQRFEDADGGHLMARCSLGAHEEFYPLFGTFIVQEGEKRHYLSEDWAFCERARQLGKPIHADASIILAHMGLYPFTVADLGDPPGLPSTGSDRVEFESEHPELPPVLATLITDIAEWAGEDPGDVRRMLPQGGSKLAELWDARRESEEDWYRREDVGTAYVSDLANWHLKGKQPLALAAELAAQTVYDFGAGIGTFGLAAMQAGATVFGFEPNPVLREFANWRAMRHGQRAFVSGVPSCVKVDAVVAWHVFEHIRDPEAALADITKQLAPGGVLITQSDFSQDHGHAMHHVRNDWPEVLARHGFVEAAPNVYQLADVGALVAAG